MDAHENARTTPHSRMLIVERLAAGWTVAAVAAALGTSPRTVRKWRDRFAAEGDAGLRDRSCRPHRSPARLPAAAEAGSRRCGAGASPAPPLLASSGDPFPPSASRCAASVSAGSPPSTRPVRSSATSASGPAS